MSVTDQIRIAQGVMSVLSLITSIGTTAGKNQLDLREGLRHDRRVMSIKAPAYFISFEQQGAGAFRITAGVQCNQQANIFDMPAPFSSVPVKNCYIKSSHIKMSLHFIAFSILLLSILLTT